MNYLKLFVHKIIAGLGYSVSKNPRKTKILLNVFNTSHNKTALLSYIKNVFENEENINNSRHTNRLTTHIIAKTLNELGYNVDVIDCMDDFDGNFEKYDLVIGLGKALDNVLQLRDNAAKTKVIWFGTGCNPLFSNVITIKRIADFYKKHGKIFLSSSRYIKEDWVLQHEFSDWIILHGSTFAKATYRKENIDTIHAPIFIKHTITRTDEEWNSAKQNYVWFGSDGAIHKGLDLVIDAFAERKGCTLHICGNVKSESDFFNYYSSVIISAGNIKYHGFVDIASDAFKQILKNSAFVIYPSASEGNSPAVITCMANGGLIPLVTKNTDVDLNGYGLLINDLNVGAVIDAINQSQQLTVAELRKQSEIIIEKTHRLNSFDYFKEDFKLKLQEAIKSI